MPETVLPLDDSGIWADDLSNQKVLCFGEDKAGYVWIGTARGANKYNGYQFLQYIHSENDSTSLANNYVQNIFTDSEGDIWITTRFGVNRLDKYGNLTRIPIDSKSQNVRQIAEADGHRIFINTVLDICEYDREVNRFVERIPMSRNVLPSVDFFIDKRNRLWCIGNDYIQYYDGEDFSLISTFHIEGIVHNAFFCANGEIWLCVENRLLIMDTKSTQFISPPVAYSNHPVLSHAYVTLIHPYDAGSFLFQTQKDGWFLFNIYTGNIFHQSDADFPFKVPDTVVISMFTDSNNNLWMSTFDQGFIVHYYHKQRFNIHENLQMHTKNKSVLSVKVDKEQNLWVVTRTHGIMVWNKTDQQIRAIDISFLFAGNPYYYDRMIAVFVDSKNNIWLLTNRKLVKCRYLNKQLVPLQSFVIPDEMVAMVEDENGTIWISGAGENIYSLQEGDRQFSATKIYARTFVFTHGLLALSDGKLLIASFNKNLLLMDPKTGNMEEIPILHLLNKSDFIPVALYEDREGCIWIGTTGCSLLSYCRQTQKIQKIEGAPCNEISSIIEDNEGNIWLGTLYGLARYDRKEKSFVSYFLRDGIGGNQFNERAVCRLDDKFLVFGGTHGLTFFNPEEISQQRSIPFYIEEIRVNNQPIRINKRNEAFSPKAIELKYDENNIRFSYSALDYMEYHRIKYVYRLKGFYEEWNDARELRQAFYFNIPPGNYTFEVMMKSNDRSIAGAMVSIPIHISPAPWVSLPAISLYVFFLLSAVVFIFYLFLRIQANRKSAQQAVREKEHEQYINKMNMNFFANISHEFRTPLAMISGPITTLCRNESLSDESKRLLHIVQRSVKRMMRLINQILDFSKLENDALKLHLQQTDITKELNQMMEVFGQNANEKDIMLIAYGLEDSFTTWADADKIDKIVSNLIMNALKFTPSGGLIELKFNIISHEEAEALCIFRQEKTEDYYIKLTVGDSGKGIPPDKFVTIFERYYQIDEQQNACINWGTGVGLYYARKLAEMHGGYLFAGNREEGGALLTLLLPVYKDVQTTIESEAEKQRQGLASEQTEIYSFNDLVPPMNENSDNTLLIIDDDTDISRYLKELFSASYKVVHFFDAESAWQKMEEILPDVVICDVIMPGTNGYVFCKRMKDSLSTCHIPVILLTAKVTIDDQIEGLNVGANAYVNKPFDPSYLLALIKSQLRNRDNVRHLLAGMTRTNTLPDKLLTIQDKAFMDNLYKLMENELSNPELNITRMTKALYISRSKFYYKVKGLIGVNPNVFFKTYKLNRAVELMQEGKYSLAEIADITGFSTPSHFSASFKKQFGVPPSEYKSL
jgi:signal transduction histidine kinase/DNA-binding response OmpR family regulator/ligand-binding sensor domain-containing protein